MADKEARSIPNGLKFAFGGGAGMLATAVVQPLDLIKNRMQLSGKKEYASTLHAFREVAAREGVPALYAGISAGLLRQATYTTTRLGVFTWLTERMGAREGHAAPGFGAKAAAGMAAGVCGAFVGNPAEVALIRMTADGRLPPAERRNYGSVFDALARICKEEGALALWRGAVPTMARAMVVNAAQLATYSQAKQSLVQKLALSEGVFLHFLASMISGLVTTIASMPVDIVKTRIQNAKTTGGSGGGFLGVLGGIVKNEGVLALWKGFMPYYLRLGPHTVLTFVFLEQMNALYYRYAHGQ